MPIGSRTRPYLMMLMATLAVLIGGLVPGTAQAKTVSSTGTWGGATYTVYDDGSAEVTGVFTSTRPGQAPSALKSCTSIDCSKVDTSNVTDMSFMFYYCPKLTSLDVSGFDTFKMTNMGNMFYNCYKLATLDVSGFDTSKVTSMSGMFNNCSSLTNLNVSGFDTSNVTNMESMFGDCRSLTSLDVSGFDTSKVTSMAGMFNGCSSLATLDVPGYDTSKVTNMSSMFCNCRGLTALDVSRFDTSNVTGMNYMLAFCSKLESLDLSGFDTSNVTDMGSMFYGCKSLKTLDTSGFDTSEVTSIAGMFGQCSKLEVINLGPAFSFKGKNITRTFSQAILPTPPSTSPYTGKWVSLDGFHGPYTREDLRDNYDGSTMAGTWVWEKEKLSITITFGDTTLTVDPDDPLTVPEPTDEEKKSQLDEHPASEFEGWNTKPDGTGHSYKPGDEVTTVWNEAEGRDAEPGETVTLYPIWHVPSYTLRFDGNGGAGSMSAMTLEAAKSYTLPVHAFVRLGWSWTGWNTARDGSGVAYADGAIVKDLTSEDGGTFTLYAQWKQMPTSVSGSELDITLHANEQVTILGLPAGATYVVTEEPVPSGWTLMSALNTTGVIKPGVLEP